MGWDDRKCLPGVVVAGAWLVVGATAREKEFGIEHVQMFSQLCD